MSEEQRRVYAVPGRLLQSMHANKRFIGWNVVSDASEPVLPGDHQVPRGHRYRMKPDGDLVTVDHYIIRGLLDGDISDTPPVAAKTTSAKSASPAKAEG
jgi:hypothetical protein